MQKLSRMLTRKMNGTGGLSGRRPSKPHIFKFRGTYQVLYPVYPHLNREAWAISEQRVERDGVYYTNLDGDEWPTVSSLDGLKALLEILIEIRSSDQQQAWAISEQLNKGLNNA